MVIKAYQSPPIVVVGIREGASRVAFVPGMSKLGELTLPRGCAVRSSLGARALCETHLA